MSLRQEIRSKDTFLHVILHGSFNLLEAEWLFSKLLVAVAETGISNVLVDYQGMTGQLTQSDRFDYITSVCEQISRAVAAQRIVAIKLAYVGSGETLEERAFGQDLARKWGLNVLAAATLEEAEQWLARPAESRLHQHENLPDQSAS